MKLLFDQNISHRIVEHVEEYFPGSSSVKMEDLINATDLQIWDFARREIFIVVSQDSDFDALHALHGHPPKIIWVRTGNIGTKTLAQLLISKKSELEKFVRDRESGCLELFKMQSLK